MRILLTGKQGQLGRCFQDVVQGAHELLAFGSQELDIGDAEQVRAILEAVQPDIIVNAAAYTAVDKAEAEQAAAYWVNETGPRLLAQQAAVLKIPLIHVSTDYVFDGQAVAPYLPTDSTAPQGVYGASKLAGEQAIIAHCDQYIILRTAWVFSEYGHNFVKTMLRLANERDAVSVVADQYGCPTYAGDLAQAIWRLCLAVEAGQQPWGLYHYAGDQTTSWHGFARAIFHKAVAQGMLPQVPQLTAISSAQYPTPAQRPAYSVLADHRLADYGILPSDWLAGLDKVLQALTKTQ